MSGTSASGEDQSIQLGHLSSDDEIELTNSFCSYIYRVPMGLRVGGGDSYDPNVVSIGPYQHGTTRCLEVTDKHKKLYLGSLICRNTTSDFALQHMVEKIGSIQSSCRECYANSFTLDDAKFRDMLILDGCFIIELLFRYQLSDDNPLKKNDILFSNKFVVHNIMRDLVLLENQIPYQVLSELFDITRTTAVHRNNPNVVSLNDHIIDFFRPILPDKKDPKLPPTIPQGKEECLLKGEHILDLLRKYLLPMQEGESAATEITVLSTDWEYTNCVTDLDEAGVKFEKKVSSNGLLDISFANGKFQIPPFYFGKSWTVLLRNMIALEQCRKDYADKITSYVMLMDNLIDSHKDVKLLRGKGIIISSFKEDEVIAAEMNGLCKDAIYDNFYYDGICHDVNEYRKSYWHRWRAYFMRNYVHTPWAGVSAAAAILLLVLAFIQTILSILQYFGQK